MATSQLGWQTPSSGARNPAALGAGFFFLSMLALAAALASSAYLGEAASALAWVIAAGGFFLIVAQPTLAITILLSTMLLTYPDILAGKGLLTINNVLGFTLLFVMLVRTYFAHNLRVFREQEIKLLFAIFFSALLLTMAAETLLPQLTAPLVVETKLGIFRPARDLTVERFKDFFSRLAFLVFLVYFTPTKRHVKWILLSFLACILFAIPSALSNFLSGTETYLRVTPAMELGKDSGWLSNANRFAFMCLLAMSLLFYFSAIAKRKVLVLITAPLILTFATLLLFSGSRSGLLSLLIAGGWVFARRGLLTLPARVAIIALGLTVTLAVFPTLPPQLRERLLNVNPFSPTGEGSHSTEVRVTTVVESAGIFARYPLTGVGIGNFRWVNFYYNGNFKPPHNSYMAALSEGGLVVPLLYGLLFISLWKRLKTVRQLFHDDPELPYLGEWLSFYFVAFLFFSFFADIWIEELHLYLITGLAIVTYRLATPEPAETSYAPSARRVFH